MHLMTCRVPYVRPYLPANTVESLVMGKITNRGSALVNLKGGWIIVPFSRGVHTKQGGIDNKHSTDVESYPSPPSICMRQILRTCTRPTFNCLLLLRTTTRSMSSLLPIPSASV